MEALHGDIHILRGNLGGANLSAGALGCQQGRARATEGFENEFAGQEIHLRKDGSSTALRKADGTVNGWSAACTPIQETKIPDAVIRIMRHKGKIGQGIDHPAVFPVALPQHVLETYSEAGDIVFEPFCGSGSTLLAAQRRGRVVRAVEIAPEYVDVTVKRVQQNFPEVPVTLVATGQTFEAVAAERLGGSA